MSVEVTAGEALASTRKMCGLPVDPASRTDWSFCAAGVAITLPNYSWRRGAIDKHDLHHLILSEPFNLNGECQVAVWEFAAGPYPDIRAQLFCLPLVALGALAAPGRTWRSYLNGRRRNSLYRIEVDKSLSLSHLASTTNTGRPNQPVRAALGFAALLAASASLYLIPILLTGWVVSRALQ